MTEKDPPRRRRAPFSVLAAARLAAGRLAAGHGILFAVLASGALTSAAAAAAADVALDGASWIWRQKESPDGEVVRFRKVFEVPGDVKAASIRGTCDNRMEVFLNGARVLTSGAWERPVSRNVTGKLRRGRNVLAVQGRNEGSIAGLLLALEATLASGRRLRVVTDGTWLTSHDAAKGWRGIDFDAAGWKAAHVHGRYGAAPWGRLPRGAPGGAGASAATPAESLRLLDGFKAELLYTVPKESQGSWVSLTFDPRGRIITSDQYGGLYRVTPPPPGAGASATRVEPLDIGLGAAHGLLWAFDSLYVAVNGRVPGTDRTSGLYRARDTDGDGELDEVVKLASFRGAGEHGPHSVLLTPDGKGLFVLCGNHTDIFDGLTSSRIPTNWGEDLLLPRQWDARGHARGRLAPGGWIVRTDPEGSTWDLWSIGYRNEFDAVVNEHGELFAYDADMEWDLGTPWYRPTRLCHAVSGSEFGWRSGTGKWPPYYPDSLPPVLDIGPGSPTGVTIGTGARFPARYQHALYLLDWTFGTMYAVHLEPHGASYTATREEFVSGRPLPLTDAAIGPDGAMYFTIGGRRTQSALYRITYAGPESTAPAPAPDDPRARRLRAQRRRLEAFHGRRDPAAVDAAWPFLGHPDRFLRYAARLAIEAQEVERWQERALAEKDPWALITISLALARQGDRSLQPRLLAALDGIDYDAVTREQKLALLRAYALAFIRMGRPDADTARRIAARLDARYPAGDDLLNRELSRLLVYLDSPTVVTKTLELMRKARPEGVPDMQALLARNPGYGNTILEMFRNQPVRQQLHYAFVLRNVRYGWTLDQRKEYFRWFQKAAKAKGGASYQGFLKNIRKEALANTSPAERAALASITGEPIRPPRPAAELPRPEGPGKEWTLDEVLGLVAGGLRKRDFDHGKRMYLAARCGTCHRFDGEGGSVGPDLTNVAGRFGYRDLLEAVLLPSKVISDQYGSTIIMKKDGSVVIGRIVSQTDEAYEVSVDALRPDDLVTVRRKDVRATSPSPISLMPEGLLNPLNQDEVLDLLAFLMSRGDRNASVFR